MTKPDEASPKVLVDEEVDHLRLLLMHRPGAELAVVLAPRTCKLCQQIATKLSVNA